MGENHVKEGAKCKDKRYKCSPFANDLPIDFALLDCGTNVFPRERIYVRKFHSHIKARAHVASLILNFEDKTSIFPTQFWFKIQHS